MRTKIVLTAADATAITLACSAEAELHGWAISIAVVDDGGHVLSISRLDGAGYATPDAARRKAETAAKTKVPTADLEQGVAARPAILAFDDRLPLAGGVPVMIGGTCAGALAISGGTAEQDVQVAAAGLAALNLRGDGT